MATIIARDVVPVAMVWGIYLTLTELCTVSRPMWCSCGSAPPDQDPSELIEFSKTSPRTTYVPQRRTSEKKLAYVLGETKLAYSDTGPPTSPTMARQWTGVDSMASSEALSASYNSLKRTTSQARTDLSQKQRKLSVQEDDVGDVGELVVVDTTTGRGLDGTT